MKLKLFVGVVLLVAGFGTFLVLNRQSESDVLTRDGFIVEPVSPQSGSNKSKKITRVTFDPQRTVMILGPIADESMETAEKIKLLAEESTKPIWVLINSPGGSVLDGALIVNAIETSRAPVYTVCIQLCASTAAIIHQYGTKRMAFDRTILMFHPAAGTMQGTLEQMASVLSAMRNYVYKMEAYIARRANMTHHDFKVLTVSEFWVDSEDALERGFMDELVVAPLPTLAEPKEPVFGPEEKRSNNINERLKRLLQNEMQKM